jgi:anti-sigma B factor antagonist
MLVEFEQREAPEGMVVVAISGKLLLGPESQQLETLVDELLAQGRRKFIFDLAGVTRLDSTGIGRFIYCYNRIAAAGGRLALTGATGYLREGFAVSRLDTVLRFYPDVETAVQTLADP